MFETVLFPFVTDRQAPVMFAKALELAQQHNSRLVLLTLLGDESPGIKDPDAVPLLLKHFQDQMNRAGVVFELVERRGKPALVILDLASELNVDVIVMGTQGVNLNTDSESTAAEVIQLAPCPVLVLP